MGPGRVVQAWTSRIVALTVALTVAALLAPAVAGADTQSDGSAVSFDGAQIVYTLFLPGGASASAPVPAILMTHGWGGSRQKTDDGFVKQLTNAGYAVLTWDQRGFGQSGGSVEVDDPNVEARDVSALIDVLAGRPEIAADSIGPKVGMAGGSYAGGIQWISAALDPRVRAIAPEISWHNLLESLSPDGVVKTGWGSLLYGVGFTSLAGAVSASDPTHPNPVREDPHIHEAETEGAALGAFTPDVKQFFLSKGPYTLLQNVNVPTFIIQGTIDTLFPPTQGIENYQAMAGLHPGQPLKMDWYCSGHGVCSFNPGPAGYVQNEIVNWFDRYVKGNSTVDTGAKFEYVTQDGQWHSSPGGYPAAGTSPATGSGSGVVAANGEPTAGGVIGVGATAAKTALSIPIDAHGTLVGVPTVTIDEVGAGAGYNRLANAALFFQLVDQTTGAVIGNQITPKVLPADGAEHTLTFPIEAVSYAVGGDQIALQVVSTSTNYDVQRGAAVFNLKNVSVSVPALP